MFRTILGRLIVSGAFTGCDGKATADAPASSIPSAAADASTSEPLPDRDPELAHRLVEQGALLLDVRTPDEYAAGHIEGAVNIPHDQIADEIERIGELTGNDKSKAIVVYCRSGRRSGLAKQTLAEHGYGRVSNLGGMSAW